MLTIGNMPKATRNMGLDARWERRGRLPWITGMLASAARSNRATRRGYLRHGLLPQWGQRKAEGSAPGPEAGGAKGSPQRRQ